MLNLHRRFSFSVLSLLLVLLLFLTCSKKKEDTELAGQNSVSTDEQPFYVVHAERFGDDFYFATRASGLYKKHKGKLFQLFDDQFKRRSEIAGVKEFRKVTAFAIDPVNAQHLAVAVKHSLYESFDGGASWVLAQADLDPYNYITALSFDNSLTLYVGTSYNGVYKRINGSFVRFSKGLSLEPYAERVVFYETVGRMKFVNGFLYLSQLFNKGLYRLVNQKWQVVEKPYSHSEQPAQYISDFDGIAGSLCLARTGYSAAALEGVDQSTLLQEELLGGVLYHNDQGLSLFLKDVHARTRKDLMSQAKSKQALYTSVHYAKKGLSRLITIIKESQMNSLVIDVKDDYGDIYAGISDETASKIGSLKEPVNYKRMIDTLHKEGIYVIARMVVFKDTRLHDAFKNKYAIWDTKYRRPWRYGRERWVDPFSEYVRSYNIGLAAKVAALGFDEIQFDYIRFPADGPIERCEYRHAHYKDAFKSEALDDFLQEASEKISIPISVDIYGITASYNFGNRIGQDIEVFAKYVDAVSPMVYPSHYGSRFAMQGERSMRPYRIVFNAGVRSLFLARSQVYMRPYLQGFRMESPTFGTDYIRYQVDAAQHSGCDGFIFWHAGGKYDIVRRALSTK